MILKIVSGTTDVATAGTAVQLTSTQYRAVSLRLEALDSHGIAVGDSTVQFAAPRVGSTVSDGTGSAGIYNEMLLSAGGAQDMGAHFADAVPFFDLSTVYVDAETNGDDVNWTALVLG